MGVGLGKVRFGRPLVLPAILIVAAVLRLCYLDRKSLWYDETATMRVATADGPVALVHLIQKIDATRGVLHPLILQGWFQVFGASSWSARLFSVLCGVLTVGLAYRIGRRAFDKPTALWGAWLCAISPLLVTYSQEARMYAWMGLVTAMAWDLLLSFRRSAPWGKQVAFGLCLIALGYTHPLGLFMVVALALGYWANWRALRLSPRQWLLIQVVFTLCVLPWLPRYFDHAPEARPTPFRHPYYLFSWVVHLTGGKTVFLPAWFALVAFGLWSRRPQDRGRIRLDRPLGSITMLLWWWVPLLLLYGYSVTRYSLIGPTRFFVFLGPAFLLLMAHGLARLPSPWRWGVALASVLGAGWMIAHTTYHPYYEFKYNFRDLAAEIQRQDPNAPVLFAGAPREKVPGEEAGKKVIDNNFEALKYHLKDRPDVIYVPPEEPDRSLVLDRPAYWLVSLRLPGEPSIRPIEPLERRYRPDGEYEYGPLHYVHYRLASQPRT